VRDTRYTFFPKTELRFSKTNEDDHIDVVLDTTHERSFAVARPSIIEYRSTQDWDQKRELVLWTTVDLGTPTDQYSIKTVHTTSAIYLPVPFAAHSAISVYHLSLSFYSFVCTEHKASSLINLRSRDLPTGRPVSQPANSSGDE